MVHRGPRFAKLSSTFLFIYPFDPCEHHSHHLTIFFLLSILSTIYIDLFSRQVTISIAYVLLLLIPEIIFLPPLIRANILQHFPLHLLQMSVSHHARCNFLFRFNLYHILQEHNTILSVRIDLACIDTLSFQRKCTSQQLKSISHY